MVTNSEWISPTRLTGFTAYATSFLACGARWVYCRTKCRKSCVSGRLFALMALIQLSLLVDLALNWRWILHDSAVRVATELGVYNLRYMPQVLALMVLFLVLALFSALIFSQFRGRIGVALALTGTLLSVGLWCCEVVSYHPMDALLYSMVGKVMRVSLAWIGVASVICFGVWFDSRSHLCE